MMMMRMMMIMVMMMMIFKMAFIAFWNHTLQIRVKKFRKGSVRAEEERKALR